MEESKPSLPQEPEITTPVESVAKETDITKLFLPGAILLAGIMISGTILYTNFSKAQLGDSANPKEKTVLDVGSLKKWAKDLRLDTSEFNSCLDSAKYKDEITKDMQDASAVGVEGTPTFFVNGVKLVGAQPFESFKTLIDQALAKPVQTGAVAVSVDDDPVLGKSDAPVTIIEFSDFQCPYCLRWWEETLPQIKQAYIDTGKVRLIYRDFPLAFHPGAEPAALAANCAHEQGKYWEMHDKIFEEQLKI